MLSEGSSGRLFTSAGWPQLSFSLPEWSCYAVTLPAPRIQMRGLYTTPGEISTNLHTNRTPTSRHTTSLPTLYLHQDLQHTHQLSTSEENQTQRPFFFSIDQYDQRLSLEMAKSFMTFSKRTKCIAETVIHCGTDCVLIVMNCWIECLCFVYLNLLPYTTVHDSGKVYLICNNPTFNCRFVFITNISVCY